MLGTQRRVGGAWLPPKAWRWASALALLAVLAASPCAAEWQPTYVENWLFFQRNPGGSIQWQEEPRIFVPWRFENGWTLTHRLDFPLVYTNASGPANPGGQYAFGAGDFFIEEIFDSPEIAPGMRVKASVRFIFPTGGQAPFGAGQYQWAPAGGVTWKLREGCDCVTLAPFVRYHSGFAPQYANVPVMRELDLYPAASIALSRGWSVELYPENPIAYFQNGSTWTWFVPIDLMLAKRVERDFEWGIGGAFRVGNSAAALYDYVVNARIVVRF